MYIYIRFEYVDFLCELIMKKLLVFFSSLSSGRVLLFVHVVRIYVIHLLGTYVTILCNWLIL